MSDEHDAALVRLAAMQEVVTFLYGAGELEGRSFGDDGPIINGIRRNYWWRSVLSERMADLTAAIEARRATPASDEAVGDAVQLPRFLVENFARSTNVPRFKRICEAALSARTAAPAEQGEIAELVDELRDIAAVPFNAECCNETYPFHAARRVMLDAAARLAPIAPDARSVDGLSEQEQAFLAELGVTLQGPGPMIAMTKATAGALYNALSRLAGAKVQSDNGDAK